MEEIARDRDRVWESNRPEETVKPSKWRPKIPERAAPAPAAAPPAPSAPVPGARKAALPKFVEPQLASLVKEAPEGDQWLHELKFDGYRIQARLDGGTATLWSRNGKDWTAPLPRVAEAVARLPCRQALIDGEAAVLLPDGTTSFNALQNAMQEGEGRIVYFVFDLLHLDGQDLTGAGLEDRKAALKALLERAVKPVPTFPAYTRPPAWLTASSSAPTPVRPPSGSVKPAITISCSRMHFVFTQLVPRPAR
jgi:bifunctional non-homologous end joining protein LigD